MSISLSELHLTPPVLLCTSITLILTLHSLITIRKAFNQYARIEIFFNPNTIAKNEA